MDGGMDVPGGSIPTDPPAGTFFNCRISASQSACVVQYNSAHYNTPTLAHHERGVMLPVCARIGRQYLGMEALLCRTETMTGWP